MLIKVTATQNWKEMEEGLQRFIDKIRGMGAGSWADMICVNRVYFVSSSYAGENRFGNRMIKGRIESQLKKYDTRVKVELMKDSEWPEIQKSSEEKQ